MWTYLARYLISFLIFLHENEPAGAVARRFETRFETCSIQNLETCVHEHFRLWKKMYCFFSWNVLAWKAFCWWFSFWKRKLGFESVCFVKRKNRICILTGSKFDIRVAVIELQEISKWFNLQCWFDAEIYFFFTPNNIVIRLFHVKGEADNVYF